MARYISKTNELGDMDSIGCRARTNIQNYIPNIKALGLLVSDKKIFFIFSVYKPI